jgi:hypothetical protein
MEPMGNDEILVRATYDVPVIWTDARHGRERLASFPETATFRLRQARGANLLSTGVNGFDDVLHDGRRWRALRRAGGESMGIDRFRRMVLNEGEAAPSFLSLGLPVKLTTRLALGCGAEGLPAGIARSIVERFDAEALGHARLVIERDILWDGRDIRLLQGRQMGVPDGIAHLDNHVRDCVGGSALRLLEHTSDMAARDPEAGRLARDIRRIAVLGLLRAIPADGIEAAVRKVDRLAALAVERGADRRAKAVGKSVLEMTRERVIPSLETAPDLGDIDSLSALAP